MTTEIMNQLAVRARQMIKDNVNRGVDIDGKAYEYSEKPFVRPWAGTRLPKANIESFVKEGRIKPFRTKAGKLWMVVAGGYKDFRRMRGQKDDGDFLTDRGTMLRNLKVIETTADTMTVGFSDAVQLKKALWFNVMGVGKGKKLWKFLGLRKEQEEELAEYAASLVTEKIAEGVLLKNL